MGCVREECLGCERVYVWFERDFVGCVRVRVVCENVYGVRECV